MKGGMVCDAKIFGTFGELNRAFVEALDWLSCALRLATSRPTPQSACARRNADTTSEPARSDAADRQAVGVGGQRPHPLKRRHCHSEILPEASTSSLRLRWGSTR
jgi:hypothetical protein